MSQVRLLRAAAGVATALLFLGCGPSDRPPIGTVTGTVTLDGKPLPGATVTYFPEKGRMASGTTDESGRYEVMYLPDTPGTVTGKNSVSITLGDGEAPPVPEGGKPAPRSSIPARYNTDTELTADVQPGENTFDFKLESR